LILDINGQRREVDCRPSDALALAARTHVPIMVSTDVMTQAGISPEDDISETKPESVEEETLRELEDQDLDVFEDFLKNFDIDDLSSDQDIDEEDQD
jgi:bifunctional DNase/RNase